MHHTRGMWYCAAGRSHGTTFPEVVYGAEQRRSGEQKHYDARNGDCPDERLPVSGQPPVGVWWPRHDRLAGHSAPQSPSPLLHNLLKFGHACKNPDALGISYRGGRALKSSGIYYDGVLSKKVPSREQPIARPSIDGMEENKTAGYRLPLWVLAGGHKSARNGLSCMGILPVSCHS